MNCPARFTYRGTRLPRRPRRARSATTSPATRYVIAGISTRHGRPLPPPAAALDELRANAVVAVDVNAGHLAVAVVAADGNVLGTPATIGLDLTGLPATARDGRLRAAISTLLATAEEHGARAVVIEDLDFAQARSEGRERTGSPLSRGRRGRGFRRVVSGIPTARFRDRLVQMASNAGLSVIVIDPAYTSRWGDRALARPAAGAPPGGDRSPRGSAGDRATRARAPGQAPRDREPARPGGGGTASPGATQDHSGGRARTQEARRPTRPPAATRHQDRPALHRITAGNQATHDRSGPPASQDYVLLAQ